MLAGLLLILGLFAQARSEVMVHLFEWRFDDIAEECKNFLPQHGYTAVQVSPVNEYLALWKFNRPWWERYQPASYKLVSRSGNEQQMRDMVKTCNENGVKIYVDVILNHMSANQDRGTKGTAGSVPDTQGKNYPDVPYSSNNFHQTCAFQGEDYDVFKIRNCELSGLHDLDQHQEHVRNKLVEFLNHLVDVGVAGFRVDAAKHMDPEDLKVIYNRVNNLNTKYFPANTRPFIFQEIAGNPDRSIVKPSHYTHLGAAMDFKYGWELSRTFSRENKFAYFKDFGQKWGLLPWQDSVVFVDNHDTQRQGVWDRQALTYKDGKRYKMAAAFMLAWPHKHARIMGGYAFDSHDQGPPKDNNGDLTHIPRNSDGSCGNGWVCEYRWRQIYNMALFAKAVGDAQVEGWWSNDNYQIGFCRGNRGCIAINNDDYDLNADLNTSMPSGVYCDVISGNKENGKCTGRTVTVSNGKVHMNVPRDSQDGVMAIHADSKIQ